MGPLGDYLTSSPVVHQYINSANTTHLFLLPVGAVLAVGEPSLDALLRLHIATQLRRPRVRGAILLSERVATVPFLGLDPYARFIREIAVSVQVAAFEPVCIECRSTQEGGRHAGDLTSLQRSAKNGI